MTSRWLFWCKKLKKGGNVDGCRFPKGNCVVVPCPSLINKPILVFQLVHVDSKELKFAQNALFSRHPVMKMWPKDHGKGVKNSLLKMRL